MNKKKFEFPVNVLKAYEKEGKHYVEAIASDTGLDYYREKVSEKAIDKMAEQTKKGIIILPTHYDTFDIGITVDGEKVDSPYNEKLKALKITIELNMDYPQARSLYEEVNNGNAEKQLSIGGWLNFEENEDAAYWEEIEAEVEVDGEILSRSILILVLDDIILDHIATTRKDYSANPRTGFLSAIAKSLRYEFDDNWKVLRTLESDSLKVKKKSTKEAQNYMDELKELKKAKKGFIEKSTNFFKDLGGMFTLDTVQKDNQTKENDDEKNKDKNTDQEEDKNKDKNTETNTEKNKETEKTVDTEGVVKSVVEQVMTQVDQKIGKSQEETATAVGKGFVSIGDVIVKSFEEYHEKVVNPTLKSMNEKLENIEKNAVGTSTIEGQEDGKATKKSKKKQEEADESVWDGMFGSVDQLKSIAISSRIANEDEE